jgi:hypothetical protein
LAITELNDSINQSTECEDNQVNMPSLNHNYVFLQIMALLNQGMKSNFAYIWKPVSANVLKIASLEIHTINQQRLLFVKFAHLIK